MGYRQGRRRCKGMNVAMTGKLYTEGQLCLFKIVVSLVTGGINPDTNALSGIEKCDILRSIYQVQGVRPLRPDNGFSEKNNLGLNFWRRWFRRRISRI